MTDQRKSPVVLILGAWIFVSLPAGWGVYNTVLNSMKLFRTRAAVTAPAPQK